jgi:arylsulfatase A-like enzyme
MKPNIVYVYADDLGHGMLSCYGQRHFHTPNIDRLAGEGVRFTHAYGTAFCAPARACLLTGMHDVHAGRWTFNRAGIYHEFSRGNMRLEEVYEVINNTGIRPKDGDTFLATVARQAGYVTGQIGKLEWGFATCDTEMRQHGWDYHYGYYDHLQCHGFYPPYVFENGLKIDVPGNSRQDFGTGHYGPFPDGIVPHDPSGRTVHSQDLYDEKIVAFLEKHKDQPFFLYHPSQLPHGPVYYPEVFGDLADNQELTPVEREYASMVLRLDKTVGVILDALERLGIADRTMVIFASDNGHSPCYQQPGRCSSAQDLDGNKLDEITRKFYSHTCGDVFDGNGGLAGLKTTNWEGGARIPFIVRWPGHAPAGKVSDHLLANYDTMAALAETVGVPLPCETDGVSFLPALRGDAHAPQHDYIVYASQYGPSLVTADGWKLRTYINRDRIVDFSTFGASFAELAPAVTLQLYNLRVDPAEERDLAAAEPARVERLLGQLLRECDGNLVHGTPEAHFAFYAPQMTAGKAAAGDT